MTMEETSQVALTGSVKQIAWAEKIRAATQASLDYWSTHHHAYIDASSRPEAEKAVAHDFINQTLGKVHALRDARVWIDWRGGPIDRLFVAAWGKEFSESAFYFEDF
jgi:hypothetical protein